MGNCIPVSLKKKEARITGEKSPVSSDGTKRTLKPIEVSKLGGQKSSQTKEQKNQGWTSQVFKIPPKRSAEMLQRDALRVKQAFLNDRKKWYKNNRAAAGFYDLKKKLSDTVSVRL